MKLLTLGCVATLVFLIVPIPARADDKKEARDLYDKAKKEDSDRARQVKDLCQAAQLQPHEKKYSDACSNYTSGLNHDDETALASALLAYQTHDLEKAESLARQVSSFDPKLVAKANLILNAVHNDKNTGQSVDQIKAAWEKGEFSSVIALAQTMNTPASKSAADIYVKDVQMYNEDIENAMKEKDENPDAAKELLGRAYMLNPYGPSDPKGKITDINNALAAKSNSKYFGSQTANSGANKPAEKTPERADENVRTQPDATPLQQSNTNPGDISRKVNGLLSDGRNEEKQGNSAAAIGSYTAVLKLQADNQEALASKQRLEQAIKTDPAAATNELKSAIRSFYNAQFEDARTALMEYLESPQTAQNPGAADFYLGATLIERAILRPPRAQWKGPSPDALSAFKAARRASYSPVRGYVSPSLLAIWDSTAN
jgi:hypothetical protein